jgi:hypothetical protein
VIDHHELFTHYAMTFSRPPGGNASREEWRDFASRVLSANARLQQVIADQHRALEQRDQDITRLSAIVNVARDMMEKNREMQKNREARGIMVHPSQPFSYPLLDR